MLILSIAHGTTGPVRPTRRLSLVHRIVRIRLELLGSPNTSVPSYEGIGCQAGACPDDEPSMDVHDPLPGYTVSFAATPCCGALLGWGGPRDQEAFVAEMRHIRSRIKVVRDDDDVTFGDDPDAPSDALGIESREFAWHDADGNGHIPLDNAGQVRAAISLASNDWTFRGNRMDPAPSGAEESAVIDRIVRAARRMGIETDLGKKYIERELMLNEALLIQGEVDREVKASLAADAAEPA